MAPRLTIDDYQKLAKLKGFKFILKKLPGGTKTTTKLKGWKCIHCDEIITKSYRQIRTLEDGCRDCDPISSKKKTLQDYKNIGKHLGITWDEKITLPKDTDQYTNGFICKNGHRLNKRYKDLRDGNGCYTCSGTEKKTIEDYRKLAELMNIKYLLDEIPNRTEIKCMDAWECKEGHIESTSYHTIKQSTYGCVSCAGNKPKELKDYVKLGEQKEFKFIGKDAPKNVYTKTKWRCLVNVEHIIERTYHEIYQDSGCYMCNQYNSESVCISLFEELTGIKFNKKRPDFLGGKLELDGYNKKYGIAIEYNGEHHYRHIKFFHEEIEDFNKQQKNDKRKIELCKENNVLLFIVDYTYNYRNKDKMKEYIKKLIDENLIII